MSAERITWAFQEFCEAVILETGHPPHTIYLPDVAYDLLAKKLEPRILQETSTRELPSISYETGFGKVLLRRVSLPRRVADLAGSTGDGNDA